MANNFYIDELKYSVLGKSEREGLTAQAIRHQFQKSVEKGQLKADALKIIGKEENVQNILQKIRDFVIDHVRYEEDHSTLNKKDELENIAEAQRTIERGWGDCDDMTVVSATLLHWIKKQLPSFPDFYFRIMATRPDKKLSHVYIKLMDDSTIDCANPNPFKRLNYEPKSYKTLDVDPYGTEQLGKYRIDEAQKIAGLNENVIPFPNRNNNSRNHSFIQGSNQMINVTPIPMQKTKEQITNDLANVLLQTYNPVYSGVDGIQGFFDILTKPFDLITKGLDFVVKPLQGIVKNIPIVGNMASSAIDAAKLAVNPFSLISDPNRLKNTFQNITNSAGQILNNPLVQTALPIAGTIFGGPAGGMMAAGLMPMLQQLTGGIPGAQNIMSMIPGQQGQQGANPLSSIMSMFGGQGQGQQGANPLSSIMSMFGGQGQGQQGANPLSSLMSMIPGQQGQQGANPLSSIMSMFGGMKGVSGIGIDLPIVGDIFGSLFGSKKPKWNFTTRDKIIAEIEKQLGDQGAPVDTWEHSMMKNFVMDAYYGNPDDLQAAAQYGIDMLMQYRKEKNAFIQEQLDTLTKQYQEQLQQMQTQQPQIPQTQQQQIPYYQQQQTQQPATQEMNPQLMQILPYIMQNPQMMQYLPALFGGQSAIPNINQNYQQQIKGIEATITAVKTVAKNPVKLLTATKSTAKQATTTPAKTTTTTAKPATPAVKTATPIKSVAAPKPATTTTAKTATPVPAVVKTAIIETKKELDSKPTTPTQKEIVKTVTQELKKAVEPVAERAVQVLEQKKEDIKKEAEAVKKTEQAVQAVKKPVATVKTNPKPATTTAKPATATKTETKVTQAVKTVSKPVPKPATTAQNKTNIQQTAKKAAQKIDILDRLELFTKELSSLNQRQIKLLQELLSKPSNFKPNLSTDKFFKGAINGLGFSYNKIMSPKVEKQVINALLPLHKEIINKTLPAHLIQVGKNIMDLERVKKNRIQNKLQKQIDGIKATALEKFGSALFDAMKENQQRVETAKALNPNITGEQLQKISMDAAKAKEDLKKQTAAIIQKLPDESKALIKTLQDKIASVENAFIDKMTVLQKMIGELQTKYQGIIKTVDEQNTKIENQRATLTEETEKAQENADEKITSLLEDPKYKELYGRVTGKHKDFLESLIAHNDTDNAQKYLDMLSASNTEDKLDNALKKYPTLRMVINDSIVDDLFNKETLAILRDKASKKLKDLGLPNTSRAVQELGIQGIGILTESFLNIDSWVEPETNIFPFEEHKQKDTLRLLAKVLDSAAGKMDLSLQTLYSLAIESEVAWNMAVKIEDDYNKLKDVTNNEFVNIIDALKAGTLKGFDPSISQVIDDFITWNETHENRWSLYYLAFYMLWSRMLDLWRLYVKSQMTINLVQNKNVPSFLDAYMLQLDQSGVRYYIMQPTTKPNPEQGPAAPIVATPIPVPTVETPQPAPPVQQPTQNPVIPAEIQNIVNPAPTIQTPQPAPPVQAQPVTQNPGSLLLDSLTTVSLNRPAGAPVQDLTLVYSDNQIWYYENLPNIIKNAIDYVNLNAKKNGYSYDFNFNFVFEPQFIQMIQKQSNFKQLMNTMFDNKQNYSSVNVLKISVWQK